MGLFLYNWTGDENVQMLGQLKPASCGIISRQDQADTGRSLRAIFLGILFCLHKLVILADDGVDLLSRDSITTEKFRLTPHNKVTSRKLLWEYNLVFVFATRSHSVEGQLSVWVQWPCFVVQSETMGSMEAALWRTRVVKAWPVFTFIRALADCKPEKIVPRTVQKYFIKHQNASCHGAPKLRFGETPKKRWITVAGLAGPYSNSAMHIFWSRFDF